MSILDIFRTYDVKSSIDEYQGEFPVYEVLVKPHGSKNYFVKFTDNKFSAVSAYKSVLSTGAHQYNSVLLSKWDSKYTYETLSVVKVRKFTIIPFLFHFYRTAVKSSKYEKSLNEKYLQELIMSN